MTIKNGLESERTIEKIIMKVWLREPGREGEGKGGEKWPKLMLNYINSKTKSRDQIKKIKDSSIV